MKTRIKQILKHSGIDDKFSKARYKMYNLMNISYKCNNNLLTAFNLIGKFWPYAYRNAKPVYCSTNQYSCCSSNQLQTSMIAFGKSLVNLRTDLEPVIEVSIALKTVKFVNFLATWHNNKVCSRILSHEFGKDLTSPDFNLKRFLKKFLK